MSVDNNLSATLHEIQNKILIHVDSIIYYLQTIDTSNEDKISQEIIDDIQKIKTATDNLKEKMNSLVLIDIGAPTLKNELFTFRHDLRSIVNAIKGYSELILEVLNENKQSYLVDIFLVIGEVYKQILRLIDTIHEINPNDAEEQDILDFSLDSQESLNDNMSLASNSVVLVVDDVATNRNLLFLWLSRKGYSVLTAEDGVAALKILEQNENIDVILLDLLMPGLDGYEVLLRIKAAKISADIPVVIISGADEMDGIVRCIKIGAEDYLIKPFNSFLLDARIMACIDKKRLHDQEKAVMSRISKEMNVAQEIQLTLLPTVFPQSNFFSICGCAVPAREVGGDFYDCYLLSNNLAGFCIGDVSGKGIPAALFMAVSRTILSTLSTLSKSFVEDIEQTNRILLKNNDTMMFVTLCYCVVNTDTGLLSYVNCGHLPLIIVRANGEIEYLTESSGPALGVIECEKFIEHSIYLQPNDLVLLYTDGISEAMNIANEEYGIERLVHFLKENLKMDKQRIPETILKDLIQDVKEYAGEQEQSDDITCMAFVFNGSNLSPRGLTAGAINFILKNNLSELSILEIKVKEFCTENKLDDEILFNINLVCEEIFVNFVNSLENSNSEYQFKIILEKTDNEIIISLKNNASPFNPIEVDSPPLEPNVEQEVGGYGLFLVRAWASSLEYHFKEGENILVIKKNLN